MNKPRMVVLTGAGISAESGLQTFRDGDGLWENHKIEDVATPQAFAKQPRLVLEFYNFRRQQIINAQPNKAHKILAALQSDFDVQIITQNIDDLHERAGSNQVLHLHGEILKMRTVNNDQLLFPCNKDIQLGDTDADGSQYRPHIVWFGEAVPAMEAAAELVSQAELCIVIGTSLVVYPAAFLVDDLPENCHRFIIDKTIPYLNNHSQWHCIQKVATDGMEELKQLLNAGDYS